MLRARFATFRASTSIVSHRRTHYAVSRPYLLPSDWSTRQPHWTTIASETELLRARYQRDVEDRDISGVVMEALAHVAAASVSASEQPQITWLSTGGFNVLYRLQFPVAGHDLVARLPLRIRQHVIQVSNTVATMCFARHVYGIPAPEVVAWNGDADNEVGAPYILMRMVDEETVDPGQIWYDVDQSNILEELAKGHAPFLRPLPSFISDQGMIGLLHFAQPARDDLADVHTYVLRPLRLRHSEAVRYHSPLEEQLFTASGTSLQTCWRELWEQQRNLAAAHKVSPGVLDLAWPSSRDEAEFALPVPESSFAETVEYVRLLLEETLQLLEDNPACARPCLALHDNAFRNVLLDKSPLAVRAFVDWDDVYVMPLALALTYPDEITWFTHINLPDDHPWYTGGEFHNLPPDEYDVPGLDLDVEGRYERIRNTRYREQYQAFLRELDPRLREATTWSVRESAMKIQYLLEEGGLDWWQCRDWLRTRNANSALVHLETP